ncbi:hypothetical protein AWQ24_06195 [Picosynechococcus sp. PCC 8807]|nr:hypothetical protein AWQ24_06195 [Picosynechococcus sp. PCC 8807]
MIFEEKIQDSLVSLNQGKIRRISIVNKSCNRSVWLRKNMIAQEKFGRNSYGRKSNFAALT